MNLNISWSCVYVLNNKLSDDDGAKHEIRCTFIRTKIVLRRFDKFPAAVTVKCTRPTRTSVKFLKMKVSRREKIWRLNFASPVVSCAVLSLRHGDSRLIAGR